jgi:hypothetical protein
VTSVLDFLNALSRKRWPWVVVGVMIVLAFALSRCSTSDSGPKAVTSTTSVFVEDDSTTTGPAATGPAATAGPGSTTPGATTAPGATNGPGTTGTTATATTKPVLEIDSAGDDPNPGALDPNRPDIRPKDQERQYGLDQQPARLSGYSAWVAEPTVVASYGGQKGPFLKIRVHVVNRDDAAQSYKDTQWTLLKDDGTAENSSFATPDWVAGGTIPGNGEVDGELYFSAPTTGRYFVLFRPDSESSRGVWGLNVTISG